MDDLALDVQGLTLRFGGVTALDSVTFNVRRGELFSILGPNGAGKTSLFNCLSGLVTPEGSITAFGNNLVGRKPHQIASLGIARTFQNLGLFNAMTVTDNLLVGAHLQVKGGILSGAFRWPSTMKSDIAARERVWQLMDLMDLTKYRDIPVGTLAYGVRKRVEIGKAVASNPSLLLLDEPVAGMNHEESVLFMDYVSKLKADLNLTVVLIEHDVPLVMKVSDRILALDFGKVIGLGLPSEIQENKQVIAAYLGSTDEVAEIPDFIAEKRA